MSWFITIYRPVKDFVNKFNNDELDFIKSPTKEQQDILTALASAISSFEMQENELRKYLDLEKSGLQEFDSQYKAMAIDAEHIFNIALSNLNRWMKIAKASNVYSDHDTKNLKVELENMKDLNSILVSQKDQLQTTLDKIFEEYPAIKKKYQKMLKSVKIEEGKVDE